MCLPQQQGLSGDTYQETKNMLKCESKQNYDIYSNGSNAWFYEPVYHSI